MLGRRIHLVLISLAWCIGVQSVKQGKQKDRTPPMTQKKGKKKKQQQQQQQTKVYRYNICNGLSNQLLHHAASISIASISGYDIVEVPDYYIVNGVQFDDKDVLPTKSNSMSFGAIFDKAHFVQQIEQQLHLQVQFVKFDSGDNKEMTREKKVPECAGIGAVSKADPDQMRQIIASFIRPSPDMQHYIALVTSKTHALDLNQGMCVHHRDGLDWKEHCVRWSGIQDGVFRQNCDLPTNKTLVQALEERGLRKVDDLTNVTAKTRWIYYCGDNEIPKDLIRYQKKHGSFVISKDSASADLAGLIKQGRTSNTKGTKSSSSDQQRDLWALIDFFVCREIPLFVGNSVSTFSAIQIALRGGNQAYWYNSRSIPLSTFWNVYPIPIVYTFTEASAATGKILLQTSIASVRARMPDNAIHVLYNGHKDTVFRQWLIDRNVTVHNHEPKWVDDIEIMRKNGDAARSHLFLHAGNYLGTWQRIDIPLFLESEYCILLDHDTIVNHRFNLGDFGLDITPGIAMSTEIDMHDYTPSNAGITLMNIPHLRQSYHIFLKYIVAHKDTADFGHPSPSDQGAYLMFYQNVTTFLAQKFNIKPYWELAEERFQRVHILHFHGPKPHDYLRYLMKMGCDEATSELCRRAVVDSPTTLCNAMQLFARAVPSLDEYCQASFPIPAHAAMCRRILTVVEKKPVGCMNIYGPSREHAVKNQSKQQENMLSKPCSDGVESLCSEGISEDMCHALRRYTLAFAMINPPSYCSKLLHEKSAAVFCSGLMQAMRRRQSSCENFPDLISGVLDESANKLDVGRRRLEEKLGLARGSKPLLPTISSSESTPSIVPTMFIAYGVFFACCAFLMTQRRLSKASLLFALCILMVTSNGLLWERIKDQ